jgi:hypothetical protein
MISFNKKGIELAWSTIVTMILALTILLVLVLFLTGGSENFFNRIMGYLSYSNVDSVVQGCNILAETGSYYSYCCEKKEVKYHAGDVKEKGMFTCRELFEEDFTNKKVVFLGCGGVEC